MDKLLDYLNGLARDEQEKFAGACGTTVGYLRKAASVGQKLNDAVSAAIERETGGVVPCDYLRPDLPWVRIKDPAWPDQRGRPAVDSSAYAAPAAKEAA